MEYDSGSSCEGRIKDLQAAQELPRSSGSREPARTEIPRFSATEWYSSRATSPRPANPPEVSKRALSAQVMEYYHKYSKNSSLGRYFSLAEMGATSDSRVYSPIAESSEVRPSYVILTSEERSRLDSSMPRERRRWARPPLIGQPSESQSASTYGGTTSAESRSPSPTSKRPTTSTIIEETSESRETLADLKESETKPPASPTSSVASHKPLEWDSGADVGYYNALPRTKEKDKKLCTIERMALARGCSAALRLDPEGTNESTSSRRSQKNSMRPDANSTPLPGVHASGESESEIEITPIVKSHHHRQSCMMTEEKTDVAPDEKTVERDTGDVKKIRSAAVPIKYPTEGSRSSKPHELESSPLKKSSSMNQLQPSLSRLSLKRSQSELNLRVRERKNVQCLPPLIFDSTSSIATVVNKPATHDKFIQTSLDTLSQGVQVSPFDVESELEPRRAERLGDEKKPEAEDSERKPPLPKRASSLAQKSNLHSILKNSNTYDVRERSRNRPDNSERSENSVKSRDKDKKNQRREKSDTETRTATSCSSDASKNSTSAPEVAVVETTGENATGRASNSFEYFPGHVYQNVPAGSTSHVSSVDTGRESRCSTMPNTSSSIDEKLWGDSDNLVRDLERSVNILKSLVDANKCDKQVKKRLIHHVIKRLVTAKYTDDRIDRDLDENVPWNPADARKKIYRNEIIQALAQKNNTTDSSAEDWRPRKRNVRANSSSPKKASKEIRAIEEIIDLATSPASTEVSEKFPFDCLTDRTVMDGRKARMGLRSEDRRRESRTDGDKSESSECFVPSSHAQKPFKIDGTNIYFSVEKPEDKSPRAPEATATATTTSVTTSRRDQLSERILLIKDRARPDSNETDWRLPTTMSERRFEMGRRSNSESGDAKLINYAEMEKRNQLVWITNEISHLCNLKRLLEEPNKSEVAGRGASSPRKKITSAPSGRWMIGGESSPDNERLPREKSIKSLDDNQWSSHGNLARDRSDRRVVERVVEHTRKRNSCTQTGSDGGPSGHSRTGGEIVSATIPLIVAASASRTERERTTETRDASAQTLDSSILCQNRSATSNDVKAHRAQRHVCYCQRYAAHSRHAACIVHSPARCERHEKNPPRSSHRREDRPIISQPPANFGSKSVDSRKEAKNQLNANCKSKWAIRELPVKKNRCERCEGEKAESRTNAGERGPAERQRNMQKGDVDVCECSSDCNCEARRLDSPRIDGRNEKEGEKIGTLGCCGVASEDDDAGCTCELEDDSSRTKEPKSGDDVEEKTNSGKKKTSETSCKSCRTCGTVWKIREGKVANRRCKCSQDYLKPVAYELKFDEAKEPKEKTRTSRGRTTNDRNCMRGLNFVEKKNGTLERPAVPNSTRTRGKCACDDGEAVEEIEKEAEAEVEVEDGPDTLKVVIYV